MTISVLIVVQSSTGQSDAIARRIEDRLSERGVRTALASPGRAPSIEGFDAVVLGGSIHAGRQSDELLAFATAHRDALAAVPTGVFQVSLTSARDDKESIDAAVAMNDEFCRASGLSPACVGLFAGALTFSQYRGMERFFMEHVAREMGIESDGRTDQEFTNWAAVEAFADAVLRAAARRPEAAPFCPAEGRSASTVVVAPTDPISQVAKRMRAADVSAVLVQSADVDLLCTEGRRGVVGIITERDLVDALARSGGVDGIRAADLMSVDLVTVAADASPEVMAAAMNGAGVRHLGLRHGAAVDAVVSAEDLLGWTGT